MVRLVHSARLTDIDKSDREDFHRVYKALVTKKPAEGAHPVKLWRTDCGYCYSDTM